MWLYRKNKMFHHHLPHKKLNGLDHLRAIAILLVFLIHYNKMFAHPKWFEQVSAFGWIGVDLFFVLSGYLISSQLFLSIKNTNTFSYKSFFVKRFFRIIPAYLFTLAVYFLIPVAREKEALQPFWKFILFIQNLNIDRRVHSTFSHAWSLCVEEQFYLLLPLTLFLLLWFKQFKKGIYILIGLFVAGFFIRYYLHTNFVSAFADNKDYWAIWYRYIYYPTYNRLDPLLVGVLIAAMQTWKTRFNLFIEQKGNWLLPVGLLVLLVSYWSSKTEMTITHSVFAFPLVAVAFGFILIAAISPKSFLYKIESWVTKQVAVLSYSIYLIHKITIHLTQLLLKNMSVDIEGNFTLLLSITTTIIVAYSMHQLIEKPFLKLRDYWFPNAKLA